MLKVVRKKLSRISILGACLKSRIFGENRELKKCSRFFNLVSVSFSMAKVWDTVQIVEISKNFQHTNWERLIRPYHNTLRVFSLVFKDKKKFVCAFVRHSACDIRKTAFVFFTSRHQRTPLLNFPFKVWDFFFNFKKLDYQWW